MIGGLFIVIALCSDNKSSSCIILWASPHHLIHFSQYFLYPGGISPAFSLWQIFAYVRSDMATVGTLNYRENNSYDVFTAISSLNYPIGSYSFSHDVIIYYLWRDHCVTWNLTKQTWLKNIFYRSVVISHTATYDLTILLKLSVHFSPRSYSESPIPRANSAPRIWASSVPIRPAEFRTIINLVTSVNLITLRKGINYIQL